MDFILATFCHGYCNPEIKSHICCCSQHMQHTWHFWTKLSNAQPILATAQILEPMPALAWLCLDVRNAVFPEFPATMKIIRITNLFPLRSNPLWTDNSYIYHWDVMMECSIEKVSVWPSFQILLNQLLAGFISMLAVLNILESFLLDWQLINDLINKSLYLQLKWVIVHTRIREWCCVILVN